MARLSKVRTPYNFELHNSLNIGFTNFWGLLLNFIRCESFLEWNSTEILPLCETNLDAWIHLGNLSVRGSLPLIWNMKERLPFARDISLKNSEDSYLRFELALLHSMSYFFFLYQSTSLWTVFDVILSNIDEVLSINPSANAFVFGECNFLDLFIYSDACILSSVTIGKFWSYCCLIWKMFPGRISLNKVLVLNSVSRFRLEMMYISLIINIRSSFIYPHDFQLLVLLPWLI